MLIFGNDAEIALWMGERLGERFEPPYVTIGIARHGRIVAGVLYNVFRWPSIEATIVSTTPRWATREVIHAILAYPFLQLKCHRITAVTAVENLAARRFLEKLGFVHEGTARRAFVSGDAAIYGLLKEEAQRWLDMPPSHSVSDISD